MERLVVFYAVLAQDSPRLCADCAGAWSGWGVCGTAEAVPFHGAAWRPVSGSGFEQSLWCRLCDIPPFRKVRERMGHPSVGWCRHVKGFAAVFTDSRGLDKTVFITETRSHGEDQRQMRGQTALILVSGARDGTI